jgi:hypothetical protein
MVGRRAGIACGLLACMALAGAAAMPARAASPDLLKLACGVSNASPAAGSEVVVACSLVDQFDQPAAGQELTFYLNLESRTDARWSNGLKAIVLKTDERGKADARLATGPTPGTLGVLVNYPGIYSSFKVLEVGGASSTSEAAGAGQSYQQH